MTTSSRDKRWLFVVVVLSGLTAVCIFLTAWNVRLVQSNQRQDAALEVTRVKLAAADDLRRAEERAKKREAAAACVQAKQLVILGQRFISVMDTLVTIPQMNLRAVQESSLSEEGLVQHRAALRRYDRAANVLNDFRAVINAPPTACSGP